MGKGNTLQGKQGSKLTGRNVLRAHAVVGAGWPTTPALALGLSPPPTPAGSQLPRTKAENGGSRMLSFSLSEVQGAPGSSTWTPLTGQKTRDWEVKVIAQFCMAGIPTGTMNFKSLKCEGSNILNLAFQVCLWPTCQPCLYPAFTPHNQNV